MKNEFSDDRTRYDQLDTYVKFDSCKNFNYNFYNYKKKIYLFFIKLIFF